MLLAAAASPAAAGEKLRLGYLRSDLHHLAAWVGIEKGFFRDEGLEVETAGIFNAGAEEMSAFASKGIDVGYLGMAPSVTGVANRAASVKAEALANAEGSAIVVRADSPLRQVKDLAGKTVAIPGYASVQDFLLRRALEAAGLEAGAVKIIVVKPPEMITALESSQIDAFIAWEPHATKAVTKGVGPRAASPPRRSGRATPAASWPSRAPSRTTARRWSRRSSGRTRRRRPSSSRTRTRRSASACSTPAWTRRPSAWPSATSRYRSELERAPVREYASYLARLGYIKETDPDAILRDYIDPAGLVKDARP